MINGITLQLLGRHVARGASDLGKFLWLARHRLGSVEIQQARVVVERDHDILRFVIEVDPPVVVQMGQSVCHLDEYIGDVVD